MQFLREITMEIISTSQTYNAFVLHFKRKRLTPTERAASGQWKVPVWFLDVNNVRSQTTTGGILTGAYAVETTFTNYPHWSWTNTCIVITPNMFICPFILYMKLIRRGSCFAVVLSSGIHSWESFKGQDSNVLYCF